MLSVTPGFSSQVTDAPSPAAVRKNDGPPGQFVLQFFAVHKAKVFLAGAAAVLAALLVLALNSFCCWVTLPIFLPLIASLLSFGVAAIVASCAAKYADMTVACEGNQPEDAPRAKVKPHGHRASSDYFAQQKRSLLAPTDVRKRGGNGDRKS